MSYKRSVFPEGGYDTFIELYDLPPSYEPLVSEFAQLRANDDRTLEEEARFNELTTMLQNYILDTEKWNKFCDALTGVQKFFLENTQGYINGLKRDMTTFTNNKQTEMNDYADSSVSEMELSKQNMLNEVSKFIFKGFYQRNAQYYKWNTVKFRGNMYLCINDTTGNEPTNELYWVKIAENGDKVTWKGTWSQIVRYEHLDMVIYDNSVYICILDNFNRLPSTENDYWRMILTNRNDIKNQYYADYADGGFTLTHNLNEYPLVQAITKCTYGHGGYGLFGLYNKYQLNNIVEYIDTNSIRIYFVEKFRGMPTLEQVSPREFNLTYSGEQESIKIFLK